MFGKMLGQLLPTVWNLFGVHWTVQIIFLNEWGRGPRSNELSRFNDPTAFKKYFESVFGLLQFYESHHPYSV